MDFGEINKNIKKKVDFLVDNDVSCSLAEARRIVLGGNFEKVISKKEGLVQKFLNEKGEGYAERS